VKYWAWLIALLPVYLLGELIWNTPTEENSIQLTLSSTTVPLDELLKIKVQIQDSSSYPLNESQLLHQLTQHFNPLYPLFSIQDFRQSSEDQKKNLFLTLAPLQTGTVPLSFLNFPFSKDSNKDSSDKIFSPIFFIQIEPSPIVDQELLPVAPLLPLAPQFPLTLTENNRLNIYENKELLSLEAKKNQNVFSERSFPWLITILLISFLLFWYARNIYFIPKSSSSSLQDQMHLKESFLLLKNQQLAQQDQLKTFYSQLQEILISHLEILLNRGLKSLTSKELYNQLKQSELPTHQIEAIIRFIHKADLIRFSNDSIQNVNWKEDEELVEEMFFKIHH
jgi:hypothetical protein